MTDEKLREIFDIHCQYDGEGACCLDYEGLKRAISDYEAAKSNEKLITPVEPTDTEIIEYYEQVAKEDFTEKETCKWKDSLSFVYTGCHEFERGYCDIIDLLKKYPEIKIICKCGKPIEVV